MDGTEIGWLDKNSKEKIRVAVREYKGREFVDVRVYFENDDGQWLPTKKGITISPGKMGELIRLLSDAERKGKRPNRPAHPLEATRAYCVSDQ
jgi:hypothetical protein